MKTNILSILILIAATLSRAEDSVKFEKDVVYGKVGNVSLKLNLARPTTGEGPFPCLVLIHGGSWRQGSKASFDALAMEAAKKGYVAATVEYRFCPDFKFPAQIEDCKCAVRFLRTHAKDYKLNPEKIGALGQSAGGHLALLLGLMNKEDGCDSTGGCEGQSSKVQAVVNFYGPSDFRLEGEFNPLALILVNDFLGTTDRTSPQAKKASPAAYIDKSDPPVLSFHGSADNLVPLKQSTHLHAELKKAGVEEKLEILEGKGHGWGGKDSDNTFKEALTFFDEHLKK